MDTYSAMYLDYYIHYGTERQRQEQRGREWGGEGREETKLFK